MKSFPELRRKHKRVILLGGIFGIVAAVAAARDDALPSWLQFAEAGSRIENALFRSMALPGGAVLARRPPRESGPLLDELVRTEPGNAELYSLRALQDEQRLDFAAAEKDWKLYGEHSKDRSGAQFALADFYHRRLRPADEIQALSIVAQSPSAPGEEFTALQQQQSWRAFERIFSIIAANALPVETSDAQYQAWVARYPHEAAAYVQYFEFLLAQKQFENAVALLVQYSQAFPQDSVFSVKARALLEYRRGSVEQGLGVYESAFEPLWPKELVQGYFDLLRETHSLRKFLDQSRASLLSAIRSSSARFPTLRGRIRERPRSLFEQAHFSQEASAGSRSLSSRTGSQSQRSGPVRETRAIFPAEPVGRQDRRSLSPGDAAISGPLVVSQARALLHPPAPRLRSRRADAASRAHL